MDEAGGGDQPDMGQDKDGLLSMILDFERFCKEHAIPMADSGEHVRAGWLQLNCPFCHDDGFHMGFNLAGGYFNCYKCGWLSIYKVVPRLVPGRGDPKELLKPYWVKSLLSHKRNDKRPVQVGECKLPPGSGPLRKIHRKYLRSRNFDPIKLAEVWDLKGTPGIGDYRYRVIAPIYFYGQLVSFQGRATTPGQEPRYMACSLDKEVRPHKSSLYGFDYAAENDWVVITEGITKVWRLGPGAVATFGVEFTPAQIMLLKEWKYRFILFDRDAAGKKHANRLANQLASFPGDTIIITLPKQYAKDPGELSDEDAADLMRSIIDLR